jgi:hypothetical protein
MEHEKIIPTRPKWKIPRTVSYPIGSKMISDALTGVPQFDQLTLEFRFPEWCSRNHGTAKPYPVLDAVYSGPLRYFSSPRTIDHDDAGQWMISVYAVPRSLRHLIQTRIVREALPTVRSWLLANLHSIEREGGHVLSFSFDELKSELTCDERASIEWRTTRADRPH